MSEVGTPRVGGAQHAASECRLNARPGVEAVVAEITVGGDGDRWQGRIRCRQW